MVFFEERYAPRMLHTRQSETAYKTVGSLQDSQKTVGSGLQDRRKRANTGSHLEEVRGDEVVLLEERDAPRMLPSFPHFSPERHLERSRIQGL